jgi:DNA-directed RNA polymerase subunit RPC12/RpoP
MRFFAWSVALKYLRYAHCRRCGNLDLQRVSRDHVDGWFAWLGRVMQVPAYRCGPCRSKFFSLLTHRHIRAMDEEIPEPPQETPQETTTVGTH